MGQEIACTMRRGGKTVAGKAYLEADHILFRGEERLKILLNELTGVSGAAGVLRLEFTGGPAELELGSAASKWADKILHPPSRAAKLGIKPGVMVRMVGAFGNDFQDEVKQSGAALAGARSKAELVFFAAERAADLGRIPDLAKMLEPAGGLWVIYPKGVRAIREIEVIEAGRAAGLKDTKVAAFNSTHTALRFVIPAGRR